MIKVVVLGSGNVAQHLIRFFLQKTEIQLVQVFARQPKTLGFILSEDKITNDYSQLKDADVYIISVSDNAIAEVSEKIPFKNKLVVHTSGTSDMLTLDSKNKRGVFYPLQTFSKDKKIDFSTIPLCLETENESDYTTLEKVATVLSKKVYKITSEQRKSLHVAAVFVCNFVNHLYYIGSEICEKNKIPFEILQPLIKETAHKVSLLSPKEAQTGPALRKDTQTIEKHLDFLQNSNYNEIYNILTQSIQNVEKL